MRNSIWNRRFPTLLGLLLITIGVLVTSLLVRSGVITIGRAAPENAPKDIRISNISNDGFKVSYTTSDSVLGSVSYGETQDLEKSAFDTRDQTAGNVTVYKTHQIDVGNLKPETRYFFSITSGNNTFLDSGKPFEAKTGPVIDETPSQQTPLSGKVLLPNGSTPKEALVYITTDGAQTLSALVKLDGAFIVPLNAMRTTDLTAFLAFENIQTITILITDSLMQSTIVAQLDGISPLPTVTLSQNYDFTMSQDPLIENIATAAASFGFPSLHVTEVTEQSQPQIISPQKGQAFTDEQPLFRGIARPGETVEITIESEIITETVTADPKGGWRFRPQEPLAPGEHTITIITRDVSGVLRTISQSFTVYAQGSQVSQSATPSATPTTRAPTQSPTPSPSSTNTPTPLPVVLITTPTPTVITLISPTTTVKGGDTQELPPPGNPLIVTLVIMAFSTMGIGMLMFAASRGKNE